MKLINKKGIGPGTIYLIYIVLVVCFTLYFYFYEWDRQGIECLSKIAEEFCKDNHNGSMKDLYAMGEGFNCIENRGSTKNYVFSEKELVGCRIKRGLF